jgi:hypothetical protein
MILTRKNQLMDFLKLGIYILETEKVDPFGDLSISKKIIFLKIEMMHNLRLLILWSAQIY